MKARLIVAATVAIISGLVLSASVEAAGINRRQANQQVRIANGIASGALTPREACRLETRAASIARQEAVMRSTGGGLSCRERAVLDRRLDNLSGAIWREKHDGRRRW